ncbi:hypothetical protein D3C86_1401680 [compost metagenome]
MACAERNVIFPRVNVISLHIRLTNVITLHIRCHRMTSCPGGIDERSVPCLQKPDTWICRPRGGASSEWRYRQRLAHCGGRRQWFWKIDADERHCRHSEAARRRVPAEFRYFRRLSATAIGTRPFLSGAGAGSGGTWSLAETRPARPPPSRRPGGDGPRHGSGRAFRF